MFEQDDEEKLVSDLLKTDQSPAVPEEDLAAIKHVARAVWRQRYVEQPSRLRARWWMLPAAAALLAGVVLTWRILERPHPPAARPGGTPSVVAAHVDRMIGTAAVGGTAASPNQPVTVGSSIETQKDSRLALRLTGGQSLRLDLDTRVNFLSPTMVALDRGAVYLDSFRSGSDPVTIRTTDGDFQPVGTQFEVRIGSDGTQLRVREGRVRLERPGTAVTADAGETLMLRGGGEMVRGHIDPNDPSWDWAVETAPPFEIEGRTLREFLEWMAREKGWKLTYANNEAASLSGSIILHGSVDELSPNEALRTVSLMTGFEFRPSNGTLIVSKAK